MFKIETLWHKIVSYQFFTDWRQRFLDKRSERRPKSLREIKVKFKCTKRWSCITLH